MSPPFSRIERDTPPPRRKSCLACVKSKRRCDQSSPSCLRCAQRRLPCEYPARSSRTQTRTVTQTAAPLASTYENGEDGIFGERATGHDFWMTADEFIDYPELAWVDDLEPARLIEGPARESSEATEEWPSITADRDLPLLESNSNGTEPTSVLLVNDVAFPQAGPALQVIPAGYFNMEAISMELNRNLSYAVEKIKSAPSTMLLEIQTPWCHASLYKDGMPRVMQDALSACALYASKNAINGSIIMRCIDAKVNDLLASQIPGGLLYALARVQALLLYQIIRFFDGDILARSSADATFHELQSSAHALASHITWNPYTLLEDSVAGGEPNHFPLQASRPVWREWVLQESARRTFLIACFFMKVWKLLTGRQVATCPGGPNLLGQSWTLSAKLWLASDASDFAAAWRDKKHYVVRRRAITSTLADSNSDDIEVFGKMLLTVSLGVEEAKAWLALRGSFL